MAAGPGGTGPAPWLPSWRVNWVAASAGRCRRVGSRTFGSTCSRRGLMATNNGLLTGAALAELLEANAQDPDPDDAPAPATTGDSLPVFSNWDWDTSGEKP